jgi:hypothetical protein
VILIGRPCWIPVGIGRGLLASASSTSMTLAGRPFEARGAALGATLGARAEAWYAAGAADGGLAATTDGASDGAAPALG